MRNKLLYNFLFEFRHMKPLIFITLLLLTISGMIELLTFEKKLNDEISQMAYYYDEEAGETFYTYNHITDTYFFPDNMTAPDISLLNEVIPRVPGIIIAGILTVAISVFITHKDCFYEHWDYTLKRIPHYRFSYLLIRLSITLIPGLMYLITHLLMILHQRNLYLEKVPEELIFRSYSEKPDVLQFFPFCTLVELLCIILIFGMSILLCTLALKNTRRNLVQILISIVGIGITARCLLVCPLALSILTVFICVAMITLIFHVYYRL